MKKLKSGEIIQYFSNIYRDDAENAKQKNLNKYAIFPAIYVIWKYAKNNFIDYQTLQSKLLEEFNYNIESSYHFSQHITQSKGNNIVTDNARFLQDIIDFKVDDPSKLNKDPGGYYYSGGLPKTDFRIQPDNLDALSDIIETFRNDYNDNITNYMKEKRTYEITKHVAIIPNDPNKNNARLELEENGFYKGWGGKLNCIIEENQFVILYISGNIQQYQYLCKVIKINKDNKTFDIELISKFDEDTSKQFSREKLLELGLARIGVVRYCLDKYPNICEYVSGILIEKQIIDKPFWCEQTNTSDNKEQGTTTSSNNNEKISLNQILYGPPGTGKTYNTINKALEIIFSADGMKKSYEYKIYRNDKYDGEKLSYSSAIEKDDREALKSIYDYFYKKEQIEFVTFHQSYGYEEFIEGIKAESTEDENNIKYEVCPGVFKRLCETAKTIKTEITTKYDFNESINIWKISLGDTQNSEDDLIFDYCIKNNKILLGFGSGLDFSKCNTREEISKRLDDTQKYSYPPTAIHTLSNKMRVNDIVLVSYGNRKLRAIGRVTGEYELLEEDELDNYVQSRNVEWLLIPEEPFSYEKVLKKQFSQMSIYNITSNTKIDDLRELLAVSNELKENKKYVLIIDEINRGNISKIFGELITLIEPSKRIGADEALTVTLPYSDNSFGVPKNLYLIGTMNTADRSIAPIDTALRRRFVFEELLPNPTKLSTINEGIDLVKMLTAINARIEYLYDRDHTIGHTYLLDVKDLDDLKFVFKNKIIPLLAEYFYDDWENIDLVLNANQFIFKNSGKSEYLTDKMKKIPGKHIYSILDDSEWKAKNFEKIYNDSIDLDKDIGNTGDDS